VQLGCSLIRMVGFLLASVGSSSRMVHPSRRYRNFVFHIIVCDTAEEARRWLGAGVRGRHAGRSSQEAARRRACEAKKACGGVTRAEGLLLHKAKWTFESGGIIMFDMAIDACYGHSV